MKHILAALALTLLMVACGVKKAPLPPLSDTPQAASEAEEAQARKKKAKEIAEEEKLDVDPGAHPLKDLKEER